MSKKKKDKKVVKLRPKGKELALEISKKIQSVEDGESFLFAKWLILSSQSILTCNEKLGTEGKCLNGDGLTTILDKVAELVFVEENKDEQS